MSYGYFGSMLNDELNRLANGGTYPARSEYLDEAGAAQKWAAFQGVNLGGVTNLVGVLNYIAGITDRNNFLDLTGICNKLGNVTGYAPAAALREVAGTPPAPPSTPTIGTATDVGLERPFNNGAISVGFTPVSGASSYTITATPGGATFTGSSSPILATGLTSDETYQFTVYASNGYGDSGYSGLSNYATATTVPQAPTITGVTAGNAEVTVAFTEGADGGSAVWELTATSDPGGYGINGSFSPFTVTGLTNGTEYTFTMVASNDNGTSLPSAASDPVTPVAGVTVTGGTLYEDSTYYYRAFTGSGNLTVTGGTLTADALVIAGGGGGPVSFGYFSSAGVGGNGAGGVLYSPNTTFSSNTYSVVVGAGGAGRTLATGYYQNGADGNNSSLGASLVAIGGAGGQCWGNAPSPSIGGSGAGGLEDAGSAGTPGQGNNGGNGNFNPTEAGGGGGGAGSAGGNTNGTYSAPGGNGGNGTNAYSSWASVTGTGVLASGSYYYAGGGAGNGFDHATGSPGLGAPGAATNAAANSGSGAGPASGASNGPDWPGKNGGSGVVIVRWYKVPPLDWADYNPTTAWEDVSPTLTWATA